MSNNSIVFEQGKKIYKGKEKVKNGNYVLRFRTSLFICMACEFAD